ncbi:hypothetical protein AAFF_G00034540 [Aldrovandia affinis]|uniref:Uncharacterized protein n=1 Tax=Aldrovandia affinis TaxID=143900 RepID=A0AAD7S3E0_9TELE|nr:hypothetical protein AAFF_G00034540 [Aldrovandia affinis]
MLQNATAAVSVKQHQLVASGMMELRQLHLAAGLLKRQRGSSSEAVAGAAGDVEEEEAVVELLLVVCQLLDQHWVADPLRQQVLM